MLTFLTNSVQKSQPTSTTMFRKIFTTHTKNAQSNHKFFLLRNQRIVQDRKIADKLRCSVMAGIYRVKLKNMSILPFGIEKYVCNHVRRRNMFQQRLAKTVRIIIDSLNIKMDLNTIQIEKSEGGRKRNAVFSKLKFQRILR